MNSQTDDLRTLIDGLYAARISNSAAACLEFFSEDVRFRVAGSPDASPIAVNVEGRASLATVLEQLVEIWDWKHVERLATVIDGRQAAARYQLTATHIPSSETVKTEIMDHIEVDRSGRIRSLVEFVDTAMVAGLG